MMGEKMNSGWTGDLNDDCWLERYGMFAHVECMDRGWWWFAIYEGEFPKHKTLFDITDNHAIIKLTTGKMARAAAECCLELLRERDGNGAY
jgi:hypothetical protein